MEGSTVVAAATGAAELDASLAQQGPTVAAEQLGRDSREELLRQGSTSIDALVVVGDLRLSTLVLKEAVAPPAFARFLVGFTESVRGLVRDADGWFDKFTGDGFVAFWILPSPSAIDGSRLTRFCQTVLPASDLLIRNLRRTSRNFPAGVGLALGIDAGPCELVRVAGAITVVGSPIVGASRMVTSAGARQTIANVQVGSALEKEPERLAAVGVRLERRVVRTKEYPEGQEAFELLFPEAP